MDSVVRSFRSTSPVCLRWDFPLWKRDDSLDPNDLEGKVESKKPKVGTDAALEKKNFLKHIRELVDPEELLPKTAFVTVIEERCDLSNSKARSLLKEALDLGYLKESRLANASQGQRSTLYITLGPVDPDPLEADG